jgi:hypothetical protein
LVPVIRKNLNKQKYVNFFGLSKNWIFDYFKITNLDIYVSFLIIFCYNVYFNFF